MNRRNAASDPHILETVQKEEDEIKCKDMYSDYLSFKFNIMIFSLCSYSDLIFHHTSVGIKNYLF
jgi:hypothetical protein